jgi:hypothetical protein
MVGSGPTHPPPKKSQVCWAASQPNPTQMRPAQPNPLYLIIIIIIIIIIKKTKNIPKIPRVILKIFVGPSHLFPIILHNIRL